MEQEENTLEVPKIQVPVFIVATSPFVIITFSEADSLNFTLEEINHNTYDSVY